MNSVFANHSEGEEIYPLTVKEIAEAQCKDKAIKQLKTSKKYEMLIVEVTEVLCKNGKLVIPKPLQRRAVEWYHHYLQHPGHNVLKRQLKLRCIGQT